MRINFGKIKIENFKSFIDEEFDFSSMHGMTLVCGKNLDIPGQANSAGKSSIFDALLYVLFGQLQTKIKNKSLHNRYAEDPDMRISLNFNIDNKRFYRVVRGLTKYTTSFFSLYLIENGEETEISKSSIYETEAFLNNEILHCDVSIFLRTILLSSDQNYNFFMLSSGAKKEFVEKLFNIRVFGDMYNLIHRDVLLFEKDITARQNKLLMISKNETEYKERIENFKKEVDEKIKAFQKQLSDSEDELKKLKESHIAVNEAEVSKYEDAINKLNEKRQEIVSEISKLEDEKNKLDSKKYKLQVKKESNQKTIDSYSTLLSKLCDHCKPIVSEYYDLGKLQDQNKEIDSKLADISNATRAREEKLTKHSENTSKIDVKVSEFNDKIHELSDKANEIKVKVVKCESQIETYKKDIEQVKLQKNPYIELYENNHKDLENETESLKEIDRKYNYLTFAEQIVSQDTLKKFIIKDLVGLLNSKIKHYLVKLGAKYTCVFDENMDYTFITPDEGGETEYATFSAGERMRLSIATSFAFRDFMGTRNNFTSNILILDEYIDSNLDDLAIGGVLKILQDFSKLYSQNIMIVSHRKEIDNSIFDNIVMVEKENNISTIKYLPPEK